MDFVANIKLIFKNNDVMFLVFVIRVQLSNVDWRFAVSLIFRTIRNSPIQLSSWTILQVVFAATDIIFNKLASIASRLFIRLWYINYIASAWSIATKFYPRTMGLNCLLAAERVLGSVNLLKVGVDVPISLQRLYRKICSIWSTHFRRSVLLTIKDMEHHIWVDYRFDARAWSNV